MTAPRVALSDRVVDMLSTADRKALGVKTRAEITVAQEQKAEKDIQAVVENWLRQNGYWPRAPAFLDGKTPLCGWYIHLHDTKKNPIILDLLILGNDGRYLELELKTLTGGVRPEQEAILNAPGRTGLARTTEDAIEMIRQWRMQ